MIASDSSANSSTTTEPLSSTQRGAVSKLANLADAEPLTATHLSGLGERYQGKVRDVYRQGDQLTLVSTDRFSAFDRVLGTIPYRGQVLNQLSAWWFEQTADIVGNHVVRVPDPNVTIAQRADALPVEVIVRGYITGVTDTALWTLYDKGVDRPYGLDLPAGLKKNDRLPAPVITPTTKAAPGHHDERLSEAEVVSQGHVSADLWQQVREVALALFARGQQRAEAAGLLLVDTKYEFGLIDGRLVVIDELHTPDSSRYWTQDSYKQHLKDGSAPRGLSKEFLREWFATQNFFGDGPIPAVPKTLLGEAAARYITVFERLTQTPFVPGELPAEQRMSRNLAEWMVSQREDGSVEVTVDDLDRPHEECGVVGVYTWPDAGVDVARLSFFSLYALQHRGQESAGICVSDGKRALLHKGMGLVAQVFTEDNLRPLTGHLGIGHNRYSTTGGSSLNNAQPYLIETMHGPMSVGHNGNLTNTHALRRRLLERGVGLISSSDTEVVTQMLAAPPEGGEPDGADWLTRMRNFMALAEGAYCVVVLTRDAIWAMRDPHGLRPLCIGELLGERGPNRDDALGHVVASESCALGTIDARYLREVAPGEIIRLDSDGVHSFPGRKPTDKAALCVFEYVYFSRPDSMLEGQSIHAVRQRLGRRLWQESPVEADAVMGVPDSAIPAAIGYAAASGIPFSEGLTKNRYIGRTFIEPTDRQRRARVTLKYNPLKANLAGKRVVLIDDSIVRGNTCGPLVRLLREGGASEVHVRVSSPPVAHPCFMGVDMATHEELIGHRMSVEEIRQHVGADSLAYLSQDGLLAEVAVQSNIDKKRCGHCDACFSGKYPLDVSAWLSTTEMERKRSFEG
ncbi:MAG: amidophosphoribosyltransferase [Myxococcales bacterium]|nr:amidophosphoribosyltransferase [Myxococcales bacterium]